MVKHGNLPTNCLSVFDHFVILALKGLNNASKCYEDFVAMGNFKSDIKAKGRELEKFEDFCGPFEFN